MKILQVENVSLGDCVNAAQAEQVVVTRDGTPVALVVGIRNLDLEDVELCVSREFWEMIRKRRAEPTISLTELERRLAEDEKH